MVTSGERDREVLDKLGNSVLGIKWEASLDLISIEMESSSVLESILSATKVDEVSLTMRRVLKIINKPHDVLGLVSPITIQAMVAYRDLFRIEPPLGWDDEIPVKEKSRWIKILRTFHEVSNIKFSRSTKPKDAVGNPEVIGFFDGSDDAYAGVLYLRWALKDGSYEANLASSKEKVTHLKRISTPRSDLNGAVLLSKLLFFYMKSCTGGWFHPPVARFFCKKYRHFICI